jgi:hypothetical protein
MLNRFIIYSYLISIIHYVTKHFSPEFIMVYVNKPLTHEWFSIFFGSNIWFSLQPFYAIKFNSLFIFFILCIIMILISGYKWYFDDYNRGKK